mgnify:CR=1 FL=1
MEIVNLEDYGGRSEIEMVVGIQVCRFRFDGLQLNNSFQYRYRNQYPILGLLSDDYKVTSPVNKSQTIVIERTGEIWKHVSSPRDSLRSLRYGVFDFSSKKL